MRLRAVLITLGLAALSAVPFAAHAASIPFFGPIIEKEWLQAGSQCALGWGALILVINNIIRLLLTLTIVFILPLVIAYAGFLLVVNPVNPAGKAHAKEVLQNTIIGVVIALSAWLIVDAIMAVLYNGRFGTWSEIITTGGQDPCLPTATGLIQAPAGPTSAIPGRGIGLPLASAGVGACNAQTVKQTAQTNGIQMSDAEATYLSCVAGPESACGTINQNYNWNGVRSHPPSTAYGPFQVTLKGNATCYNNNACAAAAGLPAGTPLNCASAFDSSGYPIPGSTLQQCTAAAANLACSTAAADCVYRMQGPTAWTQDPNSTSQQRCLVMRGL